MIMVRPTNTEAHSWPVVVQRMYAEEGRTPDGRFREGNTLSPGRPQNAGLTIQEWLNHLAEKDTAEWIKIHGDMTENGAKRIAARQLLEAADGKQPHATQNAHGIMDYTAGKPLQVTRMQVDVQRPRDQLLSEIQQSVGAGSNGTVEATGDVGDRALGDGGDAQTDGPATAGSGDAPSESPDRTDTEAE